MCSQLSGVDANFGWGGGGCVFGKLRTQNLPLVNKRMDANRKINYVEFKVKTPHSLACGGRGGVEGARLGRLKKRKSD